MKRIIRLFMLAFTILSFLVPSLVSNKKVSAEEEPVSADIISISDITDTNTITLDKDRTYTYVPKDENGSLIFKFKFECTTWNADAAFKIYFIYEDPSYNGNYNWYKAFTAWFQYGNTYLYNFGNSAYESTNAITGFDHNIEFGRIFKSSNGDGTNQYRVYVKVDGVTIIENESAYNPSYFTNKIFINASNDNILSDVNGGGNEEEPVNADIISISDIANTNTITLDKDRTYNYVPKDENGSLIFKFKFECTTWNTDAAFKIYFHYNDPNSGGNYNMYKAFTVWFQYGKTYLYNFGNSGYENTNAITGFDHDIEFGRIFKSSNGDGTNQYRVYVKVDGVTIIENESAYNPSYFVNSLLINASNDNMLSDINWDGNNVSFVVNGVVVDSFKTKEKFITKPETDPVSSGKQFVGWFDNMGNEWDFDNSVIKGDTVLTARFADEEEPVSADIISIGDITDTKNIALDRDRTYYYVPKDENGSLIFKFRFECTTWDADAAFKIYLHYNDPNSGGSYNMYKAFTVWFQYGKTYLYNFGNSAYENTKAITGFDHDIEFGRIFKSSNGDGTNQYRVYVKVDGVTIIENESAYNPSYFVNSLLINASSDNMLSDINWEGNNVSFVVNGVVVDSFITKEKFITKPETDPVISGKQFVGWFDYMGNEWDFDNSVIEGDTVFTAVFVDEEGGGIDKETYFSDENFTPILRFLVSSDTHLNAGESVRNDRLKKEFDVAYNYATNNPNYKNLDAALYVGDLTDDGSLAALQNWKNVVNATIHEGTKLVVSMGNHEYQTYDPAGAVAAFESAMGQVCDYHTIISGYHFIALSPDINGGRNFSQSKIDWLDEQLAIAANDTPNMPIFVIQHEGVKGTIYGSEQRGVPELAKTISKYPQVVDFAGHSHYPLSDPRSIWQGSFTALGTGTLHYYEIGLNGYRDHGIFPTDKTGGWGTLSNGTCSNGEFQIVEVDADNNIRVIVYDLINDREITRYYLTNVLGDIKIDYSHAERAKHAEKPYFDDSELTTNVVGNNIYLEFDQATCADTVESYRIEAYKGSTLVETKYALSDYFFYPMPEKIKVSFEYLDEETEYTFKVYAVNVWSQDSEGYLTASATTGKEIVYVEVLDQYDDISILDISNITTNGIYTNVEAEVSNHYDGKSPSYSTVFSFYVITDELDSFSELKIQVGTIWKHNCIFWLQSGNPEYAYYGSYYTTKPAD